ncbi:MAG: hypothetical protein HYS38_06675 [Acidobacteria bacterium]|nr:hypothetical protein [Acidobacteriota bacterium]
MPIDIAGGLAALRTGFDVAKHIGEIVKGEEVDRNAVANELLLLKSLMLDSQEALNTAVEEHRQLKNQIEEQNRLAEIAADMEYVEDGGFFIRKSEKAAGKAIAYCPLCWKAAKADVPLNPQGGRGHFTCKIHNSSHETAAYREYMKRAFSHQGDRLAGI